MMCACAYTRAASGGSGEGGSDRVPGGIFKNPFDAAACCVMSDIVAQTAADANAGTNATRDAHFAMRMPSGTLAELRALASSDGRSASSYALRVIQSHIAAVGRRTA